MSQPFCPGGLFMMGDKSIFAFMPFAVTLKPAFVIRGTSLKHQFTFASGHFNYLFK
jgi:hypothetical protein